MNIVYSKGKKFDIDTVEGAEAFMESEGFDLKESLEKRVKEIKEFERKLNVEKNDRREEGEIKP